MPAPELKLDAVPDDGPPADWANYPYKAGLPERPPGVDKLPVAENGYPVPWFVSWVGGKPEFRVADQMRLKEAIEQKLCWVCGQRLGDPYTFVIGPMCTVNKLSSEPPSHPECASYSARACPFLSKPQMVRRENDMPCGTRDPAGIMIARNPGVTALWHTRWHRVFQPPGGGVLFRLGDWERVDWFKEGRPATRDEVAAAFDAGLANLKSETLAKYATDKRITTKHIQQAEDLMESQANVARYTWPAE